MQLLAGEHIPVVNNLQQLSYSNRSAASHQQGPPLVQPPRVLFVAPKAGCSNAFDEGLSMPEGLGYSSQW